MGVMYGSFALFIFALCVSQCNGTIFFVGDSQCQILGKPFYGELSSAVSQGLAGKISSDVHIDFDCKGWRRIMTCRSYPNSDDFGWQKMKSEETRSCTTAFSTTADYCSKESPSLLIVMVGLNELKQYYWRRGENQDNVRKYIADFLDKLPTICDPIPHVLWVNSLPALKKSEQRFTHIFSGAKQASDDFAPLLKEAIANASVSSRVAYLPTATLAVPTESGDGAHYNGAKTRGNLISAITPVVAELQCLTPELKASMGDKIAASYCSPSTQCSFGEGKETSVKKGAECQRWRQTGGCSPDGPREPNLDKPCTETITQSMSGFCECDGQEKAMAKGCVPGDYNNCRDACSGLPSGNSNWRSEEPNSQCNDTLSSNDTGKQTTPADNAARCKAKETPMLATIFAVSLVPFVLFELGLFLHNIFDKRKRNQPQAQPEDPLEGETRDRKEVKVMRSVEGLRVVAILHIVAFHLYTSAVQFGEELYYCSICAFGKYWVQVFFLISGFVNAWSHLKKNQTTSTSCQATLKHVLSRLLPLLPLYIIALGLAAISPTSDVSATSFFATLFLVQSWFPPFHYSLNGPSWFVSNLVLFWILFPHWMAVIRKVSRFGLWAMLVGVWLASFWPHFTCYVFWDIPLYRQWYGKSIHNFEEFSPLTNWPPFAAGLILARLLQVSPTLPKLFRQIGITACLLVILIFFLVATPPGFEMGTYKLLIDKGPLALPVFIPLLAACSIEGTQDPLGGRFLGALAPVAKIGWPLYILHLAIEPFWAAGLSHSPYMMLWLKPFLFLIVGLVGALLQVFCFKKFAKALLVACFGQKPPQLDNPVQEVEVHELRSDAENLTALEGDDH